MYVCMYVCMYIYVCVYIICHSDQLRLKSHLDQLSIATSKNYSVLNTICICSFLLHSCHCLRPEDNSFLSPDRLFGRNECYVMLNEC